MEVDKTEKVGADSGSTKTGGNDCCGLDCVNEMFGFEWHCIEEEGRATWVAKGI